MGCTWCGEQVKSCGLLHLCEASPLLYPTALQKAEVIEGNRLTTSPLHFRAPQIVKRAETNRGSETCGTVSCAHARRSATVGFDNLGVHMQRSVRRYTPPHHVHRRCKPHFVNFLHLIPFHVNLLPPLR